MFFLNLTAGQFLALFGAVSGAAVLLYLLDRSRRKQTVATLRFWVAAEQPPLVRRRKRIQQPLSLLLQVISMGLLLLAIAQLRLGTKMGAPRDHVLILDTSAWMSARAVGDKTGRRTLMDEARDRARGYVKAVPGADRVMLVRADALATPATAFESDRRKLEDAIAQSAPGATALNLDEALGFARQTQAMGSRRAGEIVFAGALRVAEPSRTGSPGVPNLRILPVPDSAENCGLRRMAVRRSATDPDVWEIYVAAKNYGTATRAVSVHLSYGGVLAGIRPLTLTPGAEREVTYTYRTRAAGLLEASLFPHDGFPDDDRAILELPAEPNLQVTVYSDEPDALRPILAANPRVVAVYHKTAQYRSDDSGLVIVDRFRPNEAPHADAIWIDPPANASPIRVRTRLQGAQFDRWCVDNPLCGGLRTRDLQLGGVSVLENAPGDIPIGLVQQGPVIVARPGKPKTVVFGFHPAASELRYELAMPLLFANILRWMAPQLFRQAALAAGSVGTVTAEIDPGVRPEDVRVLQENGESLPFTLRDRALHFFTGTPGTVRLLSGDREVIYSLTLPQLWEGKWEAPAGARRGIPTFRENAGASRDLWPLLAILGAAGLVVEWMLFGQMRRSLAHMRARFSLIRPRARKAS
jgi:hypothetical protein